MATLTDTEGELEASTAEVGAIKRQIIANRFLGAVLACSSFRVPREVWAYARRGQWFEKTLPNLGEQNFHHHSECRQGRLNMWGIFAGPDY